MTSQVGTANLWGGYPFMEFRGPTIHPRSKAYRLRPEVLWWLLPEAQQQTFPSLLVPRNSRTHAAILIGIVEHLPTMQMAAKTIPLTSNMVKLRRPKSPRNDSSSTCPLCMDALPELTANTVSLSEIRATFIPYYHKHTPLLSSTRHEKILHG